MAGESQRNKARRFRRRIYEAFGSERYSRPSLHGIEDRLAQFLPTGAGYFIEAGANDGYAQSNTYWLERFRGWQGVLIEPIPELAAACRRNRPASETVPCALVAEDRPGASVTMTYAGLMSLVTGARGSADADAAHVALAADVQPGLRPRSVEVPARTLTAVLDEVGAPAVPDFLSLDVEGYEADVLRGLDFERYHPQFIFVEVNFGRDVAALMARFGYEEADRPTPKDRLYAAR